ncbi:MAG: NUDIX hydrolase [Nocardioidaceae bacterium]
MMHAAGCLVWRPGGEEAEILLVHRPKYDDWSFPKGKLDPGEVAFAAALREVAEETGLTVRLGQQLPDQHYTISSGEQKTVHYWIARVVGDEDVAAYEANDEIDDVRWVPFSSAVERLAYHYDLEHLEHLQTLDLETLPLLVVRHGQALSRKKWKGDDTERPLALRGSAQAERLVPILSAYGVQQVVSSDAARCVDTVLPFINASRARIGLDPSISQDAMDVPQLNRLVRQLLDGSRPAAICSHRPVLPRIFEALEVRPQWLGLDKVALDPAGVVVAHHCDGKVVALDLPAASPPPQLSCQD